MIGILKDTLGVDKLPLLEIPSMIITIFEKYYYYCSIFFANSTINIILPSITVLLI